MARTLRRCDAPLLTLRTDRDWIADVVRFVAAGVGERWRGAMSACAKSDGSDELNND